MTEDSPSSTASQQRGAKGDSLRRNSASQFQKNSVNLISLLEMSDISSKGSNSSPHDAAPSTSASSFDPFGLNKQSPGGPPNNPNGSSDPSFDPLGALTTHQNNYISPQKPEGSGPSDPWAALVSKHNPKPQNQPQPAAAFPSTKPPLPSGASSSTQGIDLFSLLHNSSSKNEEATPTSSNHKSSTTTPLPPLPRQTEGKATSYHNDDGMDELLAFTGANVVQRSRSASEAGGGATGQQWRDKANSNPDTLAEDHSLIRTSMHHSESDGNLSLSKDQQTKTAREAAKAAAAQVASDLADQQNQCQPRELLIYAIPLMKDRLVFLPVTAFEFGKDEDEEEGGEKDRERKEDKEVAASGAHEVMGNTIDEERESPSGRPAVPVTTVIGRGIMTGLSSVQSIMSSWWTNMKEANPGSFKRHVHDAASSIIENLTAEERLMKNIPRHANKLIVYHPACIDPIQVQEQLNTMTSSFCMRSMGKAAVAGTLLPVAVGIEILAVPGIGWYALYQLYKSSIATAGGLRLKSYLAHGGGEDIVRVNYAAEPKLDLFVERAALSPDGILTNDDVDDLCFDLKEPNLYHNLSELRKRYIARHVKAKSAKDGNADYALLPVHPSGQDI